MNNISDFLLNWIVWASLWQFTCYSAGCLLEYSTNMTNIQEVASLNEYKQWLENIRLFGHITIGVTHYINYIALPTQSLNFLPEFNWEVLLGPKVEILPEVIPQVIPQVLLEPKVEVIPEVIPEALLHSGSGIELFSGIESFLQSLFFSDSEIELLRRDARLEIFAALESKISLLSPSELEELELDVILRNLKIRT